MLQNFLKFPLKKKKKDSEQLQNSQTFSCSGLTLESRVVSTKQPFPGRALELRKPNHHQVLCVWTPAGPPPSPLPTLHWPSQGGEGSNSWSCLCSQAPGVTQLGSCPGLQLLRPFSILVTWMPLSLPRPLGKCLTTSWKMTPCKELLQVQEEKARSPVSFLS